jgi:hypothetical protein
VLASCVPLALGLIVAEEGQALPAPWRLPVIALSAGCLLIGAMLLVRQGPFRSAPRRR